MIIHSLLRLFCVLVLPVWGATSQATEGLQDVGLAGRPAIRVFLPENPAYGSIMKKIMEKDLEKAGLVITDDPKIAGITLGLDFQRVSGRGSTVHVGQLKALGVCQILKTDKLGLVCVWEGTSLVEIGSAEQKSVDWITKRWRSNLLPDFLSAYRKANPTPKQSAN